VAIFDDETMLFNMLSFSLAQFGVQVMPYHSTDRQGGLGMAP
jgi:hypothetical protein